MRRPYARRAITRSLLLRSTGHGSRRVTRRAVTQWRSRALRGLTRAEPTHTRFRRADFIVTEDRHPLAFRRNLSTLSLAATLGFRVTVRQDGQDSRSPSQSDPHL